MENNNKKELLKKVLEKKRDSLWVDQQNAFKKLNQYKFNNNQINAIQDVIDCSVKLSLIKKELEEVRG